MLTKKPGGPTLTVSRLSDGSYAASVSDRRVSAGSWLTSDVPALSAGTIGEGIAGEYSFAMTRLFGDGASRQLVEVGWATIKVNGKGRASVAGKFPDGSSFAAIAQVSADGVLDLAGRAGQEELLALIQLPSGSRPAFEGRAEIVFRNKYVTDYDSICSRTVTLAPNENFLTGSASATVAKLTVNFASPSTYNFLVSGMSSLPGTGAFPKVTVRSTADGILHGEVRIDDRMPPVQMTGIVLQQLGVGFGRFTGGSRYKGAFQLQPAAP